MARFPRRIGLNFVHLIDRVCKIVRFEFFLVATDGWLRIRRIPHLLFPLNLPINCIFALATFIWVFWDQFLVLDLDWFLLGPVPPFFCVNIILGVSSIQMMEAVQVHIGLNRVFPFNFWIGWRISRYSERRPDANLFAFLFKLVFIETLNFLLSLSILVHVAIVFELVLEVVDFDGIFVSRVVLVDAQILEWFLSACFLIFNSRRFYLMALELDTLLPPILIRDFHAVCALVESLFALSDLSNYFGLERDY